MSDAEARDAGDAPDVAWLKEAAARNLGGRHEASVRALGFRSADDDDAWAALEPIPPLYFRWVSKRSPTPDELGDQLERLRACCTDGAPAALSDPWGRLDPSGLGFVRGDDHAWMQRPAAPPDGRSAPAGLQIFRVRDVDALREFEATSLAGFGAAPVAPLSIYGPPTLDDPRFLYFLGRVDGTGVSTATAFVDAGVVGVYDVATVEAARGRGYGAALTVRAMLADPSLPAVLQPSRMGESMYRRLGFERFATFRIWFRR